MRKWIASASLVVLVVLALVVAPARSSQAANDAALRARADAAAKVFPLVKASYASGQSTIEDLYTWSLRWSEAERALGKKSAAADHLARMRALETEAKARYNSGIVTSLDVARVSYYRAEAEALAGAQ